MKPQVRYKAEVAAWCVSLDGQHWHRCRDWTDAVVRANQVVVRANEVWDAMVRLGMR